MLGLATTLRLQRRNAQTGDQGGLCVPGAAFIRLPTFQGLVWAQGGAGVISGHRHLAVVRKQDQIVAVGIAKRLGAERKICTVRVSPEMANRGIGVRVFDGLLSWLDSDRPHLTVSDRKTPAVRTNIRVVRLPVYLLDLPIDTQSEDRTQFQWRRSNSLCELGQRTVNTLTPSASSITSGSSKRFAYNCV